MTDCIICTDSFNKSTRSEITCYCGFACCKRCLKTYILSTSEPECMSPKCNIIFSKKFMCNNFDKKFMINEYKLHRETVLFNKELALLPTTQKEIEQIKHRELIKANIKATTFKIETLDNYMNEIMDLNKILKINNNILGKQCPVLKCNSILTKLTCGGCDNNIGSLYFTVNYKNIIKIIDIKHIYDLQKIYDLQTVTFTKDNQNTETEKIFDMELLKPMYIYLLNIIKKDQYLCFKMELEENLAEMKKSVNSIVLDSEFIRHCPNENCRGFLSSSLICKLCNCTACHNCREIKLYDHKCNAETVETIKLIAQDTKPCPGCATPIFKINGCDDMYCTKCKIFFRWDTLKILVRNKIHNPEYADEMQRITGNTQPRDPNDILCGRELDQRFISRLIRSYKININSKDNYIQNILYGIKRIKDVNLRAFTNHGVELNHQLRLDYLNNKINIATFKVNLQRQEKRIQKNEEIHNTLSLYINCMIDLFYKLESDPKEILETFKLEVLSLRNLTNKELENSSNTYNSVCYKISDSYDFTTNNRDNLDKMIDSFNQHRIN